MRRRSDRQQDFDTLKQTLYAAGVSTVKAAKAQEEMFTTTLEALTEAYEAQAMPQLESADAESDLQPMLSALYAQRQKAIAEENYDAYVAAETKLQHLDELRVIRLERQVRERTAQQYLARFAQPSAPWTEASLKAKYASLNAVKETFSIKPRSWKEAVQQLNQSHTPSE